jgi:hypothetical protein
VPQAQCFLKAIARREAERYLDLLTIVASPHCKDGVKKTAEALEERKK